MPKISPGVTAHCRLRNEERFVRASILSVLPLVDKVLIFDTGSEDATLKEIASIQSDKIEVVIKPPSDARGVMEYRNEMIERTTTEWFILIDGDEIYPSAALPRIREELSKVPSRVHRIVVHRKHFVENFNFISLTGRIGRIYRTGQLRWRLYNPNQNEVGHETPFLLNSPRTPVKKYSITFPSDIFFFHCHHLPRSSKDTALGAIRRWRKARFPVLPYFGPWPESLQPENVQHHITAGLFVHWILLNLRILKLNIFQIAEKVLGLAKK